MERARHQPVKPGALRLAMAGALLVMAGCATHPYSVIEGFGIATTKEEANQLAWDDALRRAGALGYASFDATLIEREMKPHFISADDPEGRSVRVVLRIEGRGTKTPPGRASRDLIQSGVEDEAPEAP